MKLQHDLKKQLFMEFKNIRPDVLKVVVGIVTDGMHKKSHDQIFFEIFDEDTTNFPGVEQQNDMIYQTLLTCAREICGDSNKINEIKGIIQRAVAKLNDKKMQSSEASDTSTLQGSKCSIFKEKTDSQLAYKEEKIGDKRKRY